MTARDPIEPLSGSAAVLYQVFLEVSKCDHRCRVQALYGRSGPPAGHTPFRPLTSAEFAERFEAACRRPGGETAFRKQLARWAKVYSVDCVAVLTRRAAA